MDENSRRRAAGWGAVLITAAAFMSWSACWCMGSDSPSGGPTDASVSATPTSVPYTPRPTPTPQSVRLLDAQFIDGSHGWVLILRGTTPVLLYTADASASWSELDLGSVAPRLVRFIDPAHGWVAGVAGDSCGSPPLDCQVLRYTGDAGRTWSDIHLPQAEPIVPIVRIAPTSQKDLWTMSNSCPDLRCTPLLEIAKTTDGGASWRHIAPAYEFSDGLIAASRLDERFGWAISRSYVYTTQDNGEHWRIAANPCHLPQPGGRGPFRQGPVTFSDAQHGWIACAGPAAAGIAPGTLYRSTDGGITWGLLGASPELRLTPEPGTGSFPGTASDVMFTDASHGWLVGGRGDGAWRTENGGRDWHLIRVGLPDITRIVFADATNAWFAAGPTLAHTTDGGQHWDLIEPR